MLQVLSSCFTHFEEGLECRGCRALDVCIPNTAKKRQGVAEVVVSLPNKILATSQVTEAFGAPASVIEDLIRKFEQWWAFEARGIQGFSLVRLDVKAKKFVLVKEHWTGHDDNPMDAYVKLRRLL